MIYNDIRTKGADSFYNEIETEKLVSGFFKCYDHVYLRSAAANAAIVSKM